jgi:hypothetical protein
MRLLERIGTPAPVDAPDAPELTIAAGLASWRHRVLVVAYGPLDVDDSLAAALPIGWTLARSDTRSRPITELLVIVAAASGSDVAEARRAYPDDPLLAMVPLMADSSVVVEALDAGADACIRTAGPSVVASYLIAMQRRRELERVTNLTRT